MTVLVTPWDVVRTESVYFTGLTYAINDVVGGITYFPQHVEFNIAMPPSVQAHMVAHPTQWVMTINGIALETQLSGISNQFVRYRWQSGRDDGWFWNVLFEQNESSCGLAIMIFALTNSDYHPTEWPTSYAVTLFKNGVPYFAFEITPTLQAGITYSPVLCLDTRHPAATPWTVAGAQRIIAKEETPWITLV